MKKSELRKLIREILSEQGGDPVEYILGCTDPAAGNYNENATVDDGSCNYLEPIGGQSAVDNPNPVGQTLQGKPQKPPTSPVFDMSDPSTYSCSQPQIQQICDVELMDGELFCHSDYWSMGNNPQANFACTQCCPDTSEDLNCMDLEIQAIIYMGACATYDTTLQPGDTYYNPMMNFACTQCGVDQIYISPGESMPRGGSRGKKSMRESLKLTNILKEQTPSSADCSQLQSMIDPNMYEMVCNAQCAGNTGGFGNNQALLNIASCCECPEPPQPPPTPGQEDPCRRIMDDIIPNEYNTTPEAWCKRNCKDVNSIAMINYGNDQVNGCKCCSNLDQVGPVPQTNSHANGITPNNVYVCESGTQYSGGNPEYGPDGLMSSLFANHDTAEEWCEWHLTQYPLTGDSSIFLLDNFHYFFQKICCTPELDNSQIQMDIADYLDPNDNPNTLNESLVKRFKKLANIKKRK